MRKQFIVPALFLILFCPSCSTYFVQRSYFASSPNLNCFEKDREVNIKLSGSLSHIDLQSNAALSDRFGLSASAFLGNKLQYGFEVAGLWYTHPSVHTYFEIQGGGGSAHIDCSKNLPLEPWAIYGNGKYYSQSVQADYQKIIFQPAFFIFPDLRDPEMSLGFALKMNGVHYSRYHFTYETDHRLDKYSEDRTVCETSFKNKWGMVLEPAVKFRYKFFFVQLSGVFSQNIVSAPVYTEHYTGEDYDLSLQSTGYAGRSKNPQHVSVVATCGFEYKFGRKKTGTTPQP